MQFCDLKSQFQENRDEYLTAITQVLENAQFINGPAVSELEAMLKNYCGARAIACANGTDALVLALMAANIGPGDEVITTPFTFIATAEAIRLVGAKPVFCDISESDFNIDADLIEPLINESTKAILPVSLFGQIADMSAINAIAEKHSLMVIEDAAQSFGALHAGNKSCNLSPMATTSFFPAKPLGCYGDGGAVFCQSEEVETRLRSLRDHGQTARYQHTLVGINSRLDTIQAEVLKIKLQRYDEDLQARQNAADFYLQELTPLVNAGKLKLPQIKEGNSSVWAQFTLRTEKRDDLQAFLQTKGIPTAVHYPKPLHQQEAFADLFQDGIPPLPVAEMVSQEVISLPMSAHISKEDQKTITEVLLEYFS